MTLLPFNLHNHNKYCVIIWETSTHFVLCKNLPDYTKCVKNLPDYTKCVKIYLISAHTWVNIVQRLCKYLPTSCTCKYLHNIYVYVCVNIYPYGRRKQVSFTNAHQVELCYKSQQEWHSLLSRSQYVCHECSFETKIWHLEPFTLVCRKFVIVAIHALFCVKFWPQKRWSCKWFDKYHVCLETQYFK